METAWDAIADIKYTSQVYTCFKGLSNDTLLPSFMAFANCKVLSREEASAEYNAYKQAYLAEQIRLQLQLSESVKYLFVISSIIL